MSAAYEAWGVEQGQPVLLGTGDTKGACDRIHRRHQGGGITVSGGIVVAIKTGTTPKAKASLQHAALAAHRERGDLPAPTETDRERERIERAEAARELQRIQLREAAPPPEELPDDSDDSDDGDDRDEARPMARLSRADDADEDEGDGDGDQSDQEEPMRAAKITATPQAAPATSDDGGRRCPAHGCSAPQAPVIATTSPEAVPFCLEHRRLLRRMASNRHIELSAAARELRERGYVPLAPTAAKGVLARSAPSTRCPCPGCVEPSAPAQARTAPELLDLCRLHRKQARDLICKVPQYTPALARERVITGQRPAKMSPAATPAERGRRGGAARAKVLRPAKAETVRSVPATPAPAGSPLGERVAIVRRLVACEGRAGGIAAVEQLVELAVRCGGASELVALVEAIGGGA